MTLFEYLAIAFSLVYSLAALRVLGGLPAAVVQERRYWVHVGMSLLLLAGIAGSFWTFWSVRDIEWTYPRFLLALCIPGGLYYCAAALIPENPADITSWKDHYFQVNRRFFVGFAMWGIAAAVSATVNLGMGLVHPARGVHGVTVLIGVVGARSSSHRVHASIVIVAAAIFLVWGLTIGMRPDSLVSR